MKKYILLLAFASVATSCQKMYPSGNLDVIKMTEGVVSYTDAGAPKPTYVPKPDSAKVVRPKLIEPSLMMDKQSLAIEAPAMAE